MGNIEIILPLSIPLAAAAFDLGDAAAAVSAFFAAVAACVAMVQALLVKREGQHGRAHQIALHQAGYYRTNVYEPVLGALRLYADNIQDILERAAGMTRSSNGVALSVHTAWTAALREQKAISSPTRRKIQAIAAQSGDQQLVRALTVEFELIADHLTHYTHRASIGQPSGDPIQYIHASIGKISAILSAHDPLLRLVATPANRQG